MKIILLDTEDFSRPLHKVKTVWLRVLVTTFLLPFAFIGAIAFGIIDGLKYMWKDFIVCCYMGEEEVTYK